MPCISKLVELYIRLIKCNLQTFKISRLWYVCESMASCLDVTFDVLELTIKISKQGWRVISKSGADITIPTIASVQIIMPSYINLCMQRS